MCVCVCLFVFILARHYSACVDTVLFLSVCVLSVDLSVCVSVWLAATPLASRMKPDMNYPVSLSSSVIESD